MDMVQKDQQIEGEKNCRSKLTWEEVKKIRKLKEKGDYTYSDIAEKFGMSAIQISIRKIVKGDYWKLPLAE